MLGILPVMVFGHHIILTGYGHWLPNDPRGSLSTELRCLKLMRVGQIHYGRRDDQPPVDELKAFYAEAAPLLRHPILWFDLSQREAIAEAFSDVVREMGYTCWACAIMSNHAHLLIRRHRDRAEAMIGRFRHASAEALRRDRTELERHPIWSDDSFKRFVDSAGDVQTVIQYIRENPIKSGLPPQRWGFVKEYAGEWSGVRRFW